MKKFLFLMAFAIVSVCLTGCNKEDEVDSVSSLNQIVLKNTTFSSSTKLHLDPSTYNRLLYDEGDVIYVNGTPFTLHYDDLNGNWVANGTQVSNDDGYFYISYFDGDMQSYSAPVYRFDFRTRVSTQSGSITDPKGPTSGIVMAGSTTNNVVTLNPCCAIIRIDPEGRTYHHVKIGFEYMTDSYEVIQRGYVDAALKEITSGNKFNTVGTDVGTFLTMKYYSNFYYSGVPLRGDAIQAKIYVIAYDSENHIALQNITQNYVTIEKGHVYSIRFKPESYPEAFDEGTIANGEFTVGSGKKVKFSRGNLQVIPHMYGSTWRFAEHQYDVLMYQNQQISDDCNNYIDLFGYGTSGNGTPSYTPGMSSTSSSDYFASNLTSSNYIYDWGSNTILDYLGNQCNHTWRTLTDAEWTYLISTRTNASQKWAYATVGGAGGLVLLPDNWTLPSNCSFTAGRGNGYETNVYENEEWEHMELAGAVFLPRTGLRNGTALGSTTEGHYWTSSVSGNSGRQFAFSSGTIPSASNLNRSRGAAVRLVTDISNN